MRRQMRGSFRVARLLGIPIEINYSWFFIFFLVFWTMSMNIFPRTYPLQAEWRYWVMGLATTLFLFGSLILHELAHSVVARRYDIPIRSITLFLFGGVSQMMEEPRTPKSEFYMAVAGPLTSFLLALCCYGLVQLFELWQSPWMFTGVVNHLFFLNLVIGVFNLLPGFPLDGGRIVRSALWFLTNNLRVATKIASTLGKGAAFFLVFAGLASFFLGGNWLNLIWLTLIAFFLFEAADTSYRQVVIAQKISEGSVSIRDIMHVFSNEQIVPPEIGVKEALHTMAQLEVEELYVMDNGQLMGVLRRQEMLEKLQ